LGIGNWDLGLGIWDWGLGIWDSQEIADLARGSDKSQIPNPKSQIPLPPESQILPSSTTNVSPARHTSTFSGGQTKGFSMAQGLPTKTATLVKQTTLAGIAETHGVGLHTAVPVHVRLVPAPPDTGYVFRRTDLGGFEIPATVESVAHCGYATTLMRTGVMLSTVEHLLSALRGLGVDNLFIEIDNLEVPILDGSAEIFAQMIESVGIVEQSLARRALLVREKVSFEQGNRRISVEPADSYEIDCLIDFAHPLIGVQEFSVQLNNGAFSREIAAARTFGFTEEIEELRRANLIRGGSLENAIVLTADGMLNTTGLRFRDEFVRHKILDIIGDLALLGMPILGRVVAERSGHILHAGLMSKLLRVRSAWDIVDMPNRGE
jgi:UDP-3-O-[3-hydroxymyristoyl] N-acetylglucosamine deacetylase